MHTRQILISAFVLSFVLLIASATTAHAQDPTPTPTPVPVDDDNGMTTGAAYDQMVLQIDGFFDDVSIWFDSAEGSFDELDNALDDVNSLVVSDSITIDTTTYTSDELADEIGTAMSSALIWRCYIDNPLVDWTMIGLVWIVFVYLIKFVISVIPYIMNFINFVWGKLVDLWEAIPFL